MWTHDSELEEIAQEALRAEASALAQDDATVVNATTLLEAVGTLVAMNCSPSTPLGGDMRQRLETLIGGLALEELDDASIELLEQAPRAAMLDPECLDEEMQPVFEALRLRDRIELLWLGAEHLRMADAISWEAAAARKAFDDSLEAELWQLVPLGHARTVETQWMAPTQRVRFWWRSRGEGLPATALIDPKHADLVRAAFSEARLVTPPPSPSGRAGGPVAGRGRPSIELNLSPLIKGVSVRSGIVAEHCVQSPSGSYVLSVLRVASAKTSVLHIGLRDSAAEALADVEAKLLADSAWRAAQSTTEGHEPVVQIAVGDTAFVALAVRSASAGFHLEVETVLASSPTDADIVRYVATGSMARRMEHQAERDASLASRIRKSEASARKSGQPVSLLARIWASRKAEDIDRSPILEITALAAHGEEAFKERVIRLGELDPIAAEALLKIHEKAVELLVLTSAGVVLEASLGGVRALPDAREECWTARVEAPTWPLRLRIEGTDRAVVEADLDLGSARSK